MGQGAITRIDEWELEIVNAKALGKVYIAVDMITVDEEKILNDRGYTIEYIGGGAMAAEYGSRDINYLIRWG